MKLSRRSPAHGLSRAALSRSISAGSSTWEGAANHKHAPSLVVHAIGAVDLEGGWRIEGVGKEVTAPPGTEHDGVPVDDVIDRVDGGTDDPNDADPADAMGLKAQHAFLAAECLEMARGVLGDVGRGHGSIVIEDRCALVGTNVLAGWTLVTNLPSGGSSRRRDHYYWHARVFDQFEAGAAEQGAGMVPAAS